MMETLLNKINNQTFVGLGYVIKPSDLNFDEYINNCFINQTISILPDSSAICIHSVPIPSYLLQSIKFPEGEETFGSLVVYVLHPTQKKPIVVAILDKIGQEGALSLHEFKYTSNKGNNSVNIIGRGDKGNLIISVESEEQDGGNIDIIINNLNDSGRFTIEVRGDVSLLSKNISFQIEEDIVLNSKNIKFENDKTQVVSNTIELGSKNLKKAVKGDDLNNDILSPLLDILSTFTVTVTGSLGTVNPTIVPKIEALKMKLNSILSNKLKIE